MRSVIATLLVRCAVALSSAAQTTSEFEFTRVLVPIASETTPGANGSLWSSELWLHSNSDTGVDVLPLMVTDVGKFRHISLRLPILKTRAGEPPGVLLLVTENALPDVEFNLRIRDLSRQAETWGTAIPVVPESEFKTRMISLLPVPLGSGFRTMVRVYGLEEQGGAVRLTVTTIEDEPANSKGVVYQTTLQLNPTESQFAPPYAQLLVNAVVPASGALARIDIEPLTPGLKFWAFASVTHNESQHVTVVAPK